VRVVYDYEKEYRVLVARRPDEEQLATWRRGVVLEDGYRTAPAEVRVEAPYGKGTWLRVVLKEGRKRQIRQTGALIGLPVVKIVRVRIGSLSLDGLRPGEWRHLTEAEVAALKGQPGKVKPRQEKARHQPRRRGESSHPWRADERGKRRNSRIKASRAKKGHSTKPKR
jgi:23S rRNA pseudouridine2605 synthase